MLKENMEERAERLALYIIENRTTVRAAAQKFGISKSTVHKDATNRNGICVGPRLPSPTAPPSPQDFLSRKEPDRP